MGHGFNTPVSIDISIWCVMDCPVKWNVEVEIFGVLLGLVKNHWWHEEFIIGSGKDKSRAPECFSLYSLQLPH